MHRRRSRRRFSVALVSAATATATALTVGVEPPPDSAKRVVAENVGLAASTALLPTHDKVPDVTGGLGTTIYDGNQAIADALIRAVVNGVNLAALAQAAGVDPQSLVTGLLADLPANLLPSLLASLSLGVPVLGPVLDTLSGGDLGLLTSVLKLLKISEVTDGTLTGLLALLGLNLADPLNLSGLAVPGLNVVTAGPTFSALKMLGVDLGWVPSLPNSVAKEINGTQYARLGVDGVLDLLLDKLKASSILGASELVAPLAALIQKITDPLTSQLPDVVDVRVVPTVGIGLGAFAAAQAYRQVLADLSLQPGGLNHVFGADPVLGSLTILPLILINNPSRPDGGALARFGPLAALLGIDTVNPTTKASSSGDGKGPAIPVIGTGVTLGNANLVPILVDATYEYQPLSDLASWPNAFTLVNNLAAGLSPTYMLRGLNLDVDALTKQILTGVGAVVDGLDPTDPTSALAVNLYLTLGAKTLPMLEPLYLASDFLNVVGLSPLAQIPMRLANALAPALRILTDVGYSDVVRNADGTYERIPNSAQETPFLTFPHLDPGLVLSDAFNALVAGFQRELGPNPTPNTPNVLANLLDALFKGSPLGGLNLANPLASLAPPAPVAKAAAPSTTEAVQLPSAAAKLVGIAPAAESNKVVVQKDSTSDDAQTAGGDVTPAEDETPAVKTPEVKTPVAGDQTDTAQTTSATNQDPTPASGPKHAKPEGDSTPSAGAQAGAAVGPTTGPKHAKPEQGVVRDSPNFSTTAPASSGGSATGGGSTTGGTSADTGKKAADTSAAGDSAPAGGSSTGAAAA